MALPNAPVVVAIPPGIGGAAMLNSVINAPMTFLLNKPVFRARCTTTTGFALLGVATPWNTVDEDNYGGWGPSQASPLSNTIYVAQQPGWYGVACTVCVAGTGTASSIMMPRISLNGASPLQSTTGVWEGSEVGSPTTSGQPQATVGYWEIYCAPGDQVVVQTYLSATSTQTWNTAAGQESRISILWKASY